MEWITLRNVSTSKHYSKEARYIWIFSNQNDSWNKNQIDMHQRVKVRHFFLWLRRVCVCSVLWLTLCKPLDCSPPGSCVHGDSPGKNTGVGCHTLLQRIFPTQELNLCLLCFLNWQVDSLLHHLGSPPLTKLKPKWSPTKLKQANQAIKYLNQTAQKKKKKKEE